MSRGPVARSLEELDDLERQNLEAGTMGEAYSPPSDTMEAINRVAVRPDDEQSVPVAAVAGTMEPKKKTQLESLQEWIAAENAKLSGMTHEREKAIADAKAAAREGDTGRSIVNSIAAAGSVLAGNKDLAKGYIAAAGEDRGAQKAAQDDAALRAWVAKQQEGIIQRGHLIQQASKEDADEYGSIQKGIAHAEEMRAKAKKDAEQQAYDRNKDRENFNQRERAIGTTIGEKRAAEGRADKKEERGDAKTAAKELQKEVDEYGKGVGGFIPEINQLLGNVKRLIPAKGDVPGVGGLDRWKILGDLTGKNNTEMRLALEALKNKLLRKESGAAISDNEQTLKDLELGLNIGAGEKAFRLGMKALEDQVQAFIASQQARFSPEAISIYDERRKAATGKIGHKTAPPPRAAPQAGPDEGSEKILNGKVMVFRNGEWDWK